jgi:hypothetical protein
MPVRFDQPMNALEVEDVTPVVDLEAGCKKTFV